MKLILEDNAGIAQRTFFVEGDEGFVIARKDTRRLEVHPNLAGLEAAKIAFEQMGHVTLANLEKQAFEVKGKGKLRLINEAPKAIGQNEPLREENVRNWYMSLSGLILVFIATGTWVLTRPIETAKIEERLKQQVVQIVKRIPPKMVRPQSTITSQVTNDAKTVKTTSKTATIKRMGALSVLGSLKSGKQKGGIDLGAVNTTAGPGLGGTGGSGGTQTSLYGKGLVSAPLGAGSNMQGGGGYGTKGKGGGQAGYGKLSLVGSAGTSAIPLGREALVESGLDRDLVADVIARNMGQIRFCYEQGLQGNPGLAGRVAVGFTIGGSGIVKLAGVESTSLNSKQVEDCIVARLKSWKFPLPEGSRDVKVVYPFNLRRAGQG